MEPSISYHLLLKCLFYHRPLLHKTENNHCEQRDTGGSKRFLKMACNPLEMKGSLQVALLNIGDDRDDDLISLKTPIN